MLNEKILFESRVAAQKLLSEGLSTILKEESPTRRSLIIWGVMRIDYIKSSGMLNIQMLNESNMHISYARYLHLTSKVTGCSVPYDEILTVYCQWKISSLIMEPLGPAKKILAAMLSIEIMEQSVMINIYSTWRKLYNYWLLPQDIAKITRDTYGANFNINQFNTIKQHKVLAREVMAKSRILLPLLGWIIASKYSNTEKLLFGKNVTTKVYFDGFRRALIEHGTSFKQPPLERFSLKATPFFSCNRQWARLRFSPATWRFLIKQPISIVRMLVNHSTDISDITTPMIYLGKTGESQIPKPALRFILDHCFTSGYLWSKQYNHELNIVFQRLFIRECKLSYQRHRQIKNFINISGGVFDWLRFDGFNNGYPYNNSTWKSLLRTSANWHEQLTKVDEQSKRASWTSALNSIEIDDCKILALTNGQMLIDHGAEMLHCVAKYWTDCLQGISRIFAIKSESGQSTLEIRHRDGVWYIAQHWTISNRTPAKQHTKVGPKLLKAYQEASIESAW
jgi:hypothetical protein